MNNNDMTLNYPAPNIATMDALRAQINSQVSILKLGFVPAMKEKLLPLQRTLTRGDNVFRQEMGAIIVRLKGAGLGAVELKRQQVEAATQLSPEARSRALAQLDAHAAGIINDLRKAIYDGGRAIAQVTDDVVQINVQLKDNRLRDMLQSNLDRLTQNITELQAKMNAINADRQVLDKTIETFEKFNLADVFKDSLPTIEELKTLSLPSPELALAQAGLVRLQNLLGDLSRGLTWLDLVGERDKLRARYSEALDQSREFEAESRQSVQDLNEVDGLDSVHRSKTDWAAEARKASDALTAFRNSFMSETAPRLSDQLVKHLIGYINSFYTIDRTP